MKKELFICLIIIIAIIISDVILQRYTDKSMDNLNYKLSQLKQEIYKETFDEDKINEIIDNWDNNYKIYTCYLEHDELEKINTQLIVIKSAMEVQDKESVYEEIDKAIYIINHVESKQMLKLDNIL